MDIIFDKYNVDIYLIKQNKKKRGKFENRNIRFSIFIYYLFNTVSVATSKL